MQTALTPDERVSELLDAMLGSPIDDRRMDAFVSAMDARKLVFPSTRSIAFLESPVCAWLVSKGSAVALVLLDEEEAFYRLDQQRYENARRDVMTEPTTRSYAIAMLDAVYLFANGTMAKQNRWLEAAARDATLTYTQLRDYLHGDLGAPYLLAVRVAWNQTASLNSLAAPRRKRNALGRLPVGEWGWL